MADSLLAYGRVIPISEILDEYEAVTHEKIGEGSGAACWTSRSSH